MQESPSDRRKLHRIEDELDDVHDRLVAVVDEVGSITAVRHDIRLIGVARDLHRISRDLERELWKLAGLGVDLCEPTCQT